MTGDSATCDIGWVQISSKLILARAVDVPGPECTSHLSRLYGHVNSAGRRCWNQPPHWVLRIWKWQLNEREASLVDAFRRLPRTTATELSDAGPALVLGPCANSHRNSQNRLVHFWSDEDFLNDFKGLGNRDVYPPVEISKHQNKPIIEIGPLLVKPGRCVGGVLVGAQETKVRPAVVNTR